LTNLRISHKRLELREHTKVEFDVSKVCNCSHIDSPVWFLTFLTCIPLFPNSQARLLAAFHLPLPRAGFITQTMRPLLNALASGQIHIKLSAPGRFSARPAPHTDVQDLVRRCLELGADQCLWASDWPHTDCVLPVIEDRIWYKVVQGIAGDTFEQMHATAAALDQ